MQCNNEEELLEWGGMITHATLVSNGGFHIVQLEAKLEDERRRKSLEYKQTDEYRAQVAETQRQAEAEELRVAAEAEAARAAAEEAERSLQQRVERERIAVERAERDTREAAERQQRLQKLEEAAQTGFTAYPFTGNSAESQISFEAGVAVVVLDDSGVEWWFGRVNEQQGWFPPTFLRPAADIHEWLGTLNMWTYRQTFVDEGFDSMTSVALLTEEDLEEMNIEHDKRSIVVRSAKYQKSLADKLEEMR